MIKRFIDALAARSAPQPPTTEAEAAAALLVHAARSDGDYAPEERAIILRILGEAFALTGSDAAAALVAAEAAEAAAVDIQRFSKVLKEALSADEREAFLERMWRVALADGQRDPQEDALMRKLAALLYVPDARNNMARRRAEQR